MVLIWIINCQCFFTWYTFIYSVHQTVNICACFSELHIRVITLDELGTFVHGWKEEAITCSWTNYLIKTFSFYYTRLSYINRYIYVPHDFHMFIMFKLYFYLIYCQWVDQALTPAFVNSMLCMMWFPWFRLNFATSCCCFFCCFDLTFSIVVWLPLPWFDFNFGISWFKFILLHVLAIYISSWIFCFFCLKDFRHQHSVWWCDSPGSSIQDFRFGMWWFC